MADCDAPLGTVYLVGAGPGSPDLITVRGLNLLRRADVVVYDALIHRDLLKEVPPEAEHVYAGKRGYCVGSTLQETINDVLVNRARQGLTVVRLKGGDPCVFGRGGEEAEYLAERGIPFEIVPGITTAVGACAAASIPLTHRDAGQSIALVTGHFDPDSPDCILDWPGLARMSNLVVYMGLRHVEKIAARLIEAGMPPDTPAAAVASATLPDQVVIDSTLSRLAAAVREADLRAPAVLVIGEAVRYRSKLLGGAEGCSRRMWWDADPLTRSSEAAPASPPHGGGEAKASPSVALPASARSSPLPRRVGGEVAERGDAGEGGQTPPPIPIPGLTTRRSPTVEGASA